MPNSKASNEVNQAFKECPLNRMWTQSRVPADFRLALGQPQMRQGFVAESS